MAEVRAELKAFLDRIFSNESDYRLKTAEAWLPSFRDEPAFAHLTVNDLAAAFVLVGITGGNGRNSIMLEYRGPSKQTPFRSWVNTDGSLHVSGKIFD